jgi:hypothetical protein
MSIPTRMASQSRGRRRLGAEETRNLAQEGTAKGELIMALNDKLNARIDEEVDVGDGSLLPIIDGHWHPERA